MMKPNELNIGGIVYLDVAKDNRDWGYDPGPDGTKCEVISYDCTPAAGGPNKYWPTIRFLEGEHRDETYRILTIHLSKSNPLAKSVKGFGMKESTQENDRHADIMKLETAVRRGGRIDIPEWLADTPIGVCLYRVISGEPGVSFRAEILRVIILLAAKDAR